MLLATSSTTTHTHTHTRMLCILCFYPEGVPIPRFFFVLSHLTLSNLIIFPPPPPSSFIFPSSRTHTHTVSFPYGVASFHLPARCQRFPDSINKRFITQKLTEQQSLSPLCCFSDSFPLTFCYLALTHITQRVTQSL